MVDRGNDVGGGGGRQHGRYRQCHRRRWSSDKRFRDCWIISSSSHTSDNCVDKKMLILVLVLSKTCNTRQEIARAIQVDPQRDTTCLLIGLFGLGVI